MLERDHAVRLGDRIARGDQRIVLTVNMDDERVARRRIGAHRNAGHVAQRGGDLRRARVIPRHPRQLRAQAFARGDGVGIHAKRGRARAPDPHARGRDRRRIAGERAARDAAQAFVERHVDGVRDRRDLRDRSAETWCGLPQSRAVDVEGGARVTRVRGDGAELVPRGYAIARAPQRELDDDGSERFVDGGELRERKRFDQRADARDAQTVQRADRIVLVFDDVRPRVRRDDRATAAVGMHAQRRQLRGFAAGAEDRRFFAEQRGDLALEIFDDRARAVRVERGVVRSASASARSVCAGLGSVLRERWGGSVRITRDVSPLRSTGPVVTRRTSGVGSSANTSSGSRLPRTFCAPSGRTT